MSTYEIKLPQFEGPFDLLLFFIERDELDIYDIPIAKITDDFLGYIHQLKELDIEVASEFILVASTLIRIKSRLLLPRKELDEEGKEIDPREELVQKLLEYKRYKSVLEELRLMEESRGRMLRRGNIKDDGKLILNTLSGEQELQSLTLYKLLEAFQRVMNRFEANQETVTHRILQYPYTIPSQKQSLLKRLFENKQPISFSALFDSCDNRIHAIFNFLALLELVQSNQVSIEINSLTYNDFEVSLTELPIVSAN